MLFNVVGVYTGQSRQTGKEFSMLHVIEVERQQTGLRGKAVSTYFCTKEVADVIIPGETYNLETFFGSKNVVSAELVDDK